MPGVRGFVTVLVLVLIGFGLGIVIGRGGLKELRTESATLQARVQDLGKELQESRARGRLNDAMSRLSRVYVDVSENNFGQARVALVAARDRVSEAVNDLDTSAELRTELEAIRQRLTEIEADLIELRTEARDELAEVIERIRRLTGE